MSAVLAVAGFLVAPDDRPMVGMVVAVTLVALWEAAWVALAGGTPGKLLCRLRVRRLGEDKVPWAAALERGVIVAATNVTMVGIPVLIGSVLLSPLRRGFHDRRTGTIVVERELRSVGANDLPTLAVRDRPVRPTPFGPATPIDRRLAARLARLDRSPLLVAALVALLAAVEFGGEAWMVLGASGLWLVLFVADEAWRVTRGGANPGHATEGLTVVDVRTGRPPRPGRAVLRAAVLAPLLYVPPLQVVLWIWIARSRYWRGPHDMAGRTVVVQSRSAAVWA